VREEGGKGRRRGREKKGGRGDGRGRGGRRGGNGRGRQQVVGMSLQSLVHLLKD
jgi:hypothetical protein